MKHFYIYITTNLINNKKYIGQHYGELDDSYLGSGNISALSGNSALQNLFVMASGGNYGRLLTGGLNARNASALLQNIVDRKSVV